MNDLGFVLRQLLKNPGFAIVAVLTLALSIGANTTVFSVTNAILLRSLPVPNPQELRVIEWSGANVHDPAIPLTDLTAQEAVRDKATSQERTFATLCGSLAALSILLSCTALYGLMAYCVSGRTGEIALGATRRQIARTILKDALLLGGAGVVIGIPLTLALTQVIRSRLYGAALCPKRQITRS